MTQTRTKTDKLFEQALTAQEQGEQATATQLYRKILTNDPSHLEAQFNLAVLYHDQGKLEAALAGYEQCLARDPKLAQAYKNIGDIKFRQYDPPAAREAYRRALTLAPKATTWHNLGLAEAACGNLEAASQAWRQALRLDPGHLRAGISLIENLRQSGDYRDAEKVCRKLRERFPENSELELLAARINWSVGRLSQAAKLCQQLLRQQADNPQTLNLLGLIHMQLGNPDKAGQYLRKALQADPELPAVHSNLLYSSLMAANLSPTAYLEEARNWHRRHTPKMVSPPPKTKKTVDNRIHLAFVSPDLRRHSVAFFLLPLLKNIDHSRFRITLYADHPQNDDYSTKLRKHCDAWQQIHGLDDNQLANLLQHEQPMVLVELAGHSAGNRLPLLARRPVPIIVSWLGYPASTGLENGFYRLGDPLVDPPGAERFYSEKLLRLPTPFICYAPPAEALDIPPKPPVKNRPVTFGSFNNPAKLNPQVIAIWSRLLQRVPNSRLLLKSKFFQDPTTVAHFQQRFREHGISPKRLWFHPGNPDPTEHFAMYHEIDIALDTFPYNGTTTTCEALWMGVPVIALTGTHHAARVGTTLLTAIGFPELAADNLEQYLEIAATLADDPKRRATLHQRLRPQMAASSLLDGHQFASNFTFAIHSLLINDDLPTSLSTAATNQARQLTPQSPSLPAVQPSLQILLEQACTLHNQEQYPKAEVLYRYIIENDPNLANQAAINLARLSRANGTPKQGLATIERWLATKPATLPPSSDLYRELATLHHFMGNHDQAKTALEKALIANPDDFPALNNLGLLLTHNQPEKAAELFARALKIRPDQAEIVDNLKLCSMLNGDWSQITRLDNRNPDQAVRPQTPTPTRLFLSLATNDDVSDNYRLAHVWCSNNFNQEKFFLAGCYNDFYRPPKDPPDMLKIAYLSGDFCDHPVAHNLVGLFARHDRSRFQVSAYAFGPNDESGYRERIIAGCDRFLDISNLNDRDAALRIREDNIDILIELMGHTRDNRLGICAFRPAPVQISYLGYPGTTGASFIDYLIADPIVIPPEQQQFYSEKILYLPDCFMLADRPEIAPRPTRRECGLPETGPIFASFNNAYKIEPVMFDVWMEILKQAPDGVLWLRPGSRLLQENLRREAVSRGISPERLIFAAWSKTKAQHLGRLRLADLALDTRIYNGHTTTLDALWAGVPVITVPGRHFASRVSASQLRAIGLEELICRDLETYRQMAIELTQNPERLRRLRDKLDHNRMTHPLFDTAAGARKLEQAYLEAWRDKQATIQKEGPPIKPTANV